MLWIKIKNLFFNENKSMNKRGKIISIISATAKKTFYCDGKYNLVNIRHTVAIHDNL